MWISLPWLTSCMIVFGVSSFQFSVGGNYNSSFLHKSAPTSRLSTSQRPQQQNKLSQLQPTQQESASFSWFLWIDHVKTFEFIDNAMNVLGSVRECFTVLRARSRVSGAGAMVSARPERNFIAASKHSVQSGVGVTGGRRGQSSLKPRNKDQLS